MAERTHEPDPLQVLGALERIRAQEGGDAVADDLCATIVSWGRWGRAAFVSHGPGGFTFGAAGLAPEAAKGLARDVQQIVASAVAQHPEQGQPVRLEAAITHR